jgi:hypothetical protein
MIGEGGRRGKTPRGVNPTCEDRNAAEGRDRRRVREPNRSRLKASLPLLFRGPRRPRGLRSSRRKAQPPLGELARRRRAPGLGVRGAWAPSRASRCPPTRARPPVPPGPRPAALSGEHAAPWRPPRPGWVLQVLAGSRPRSRAHRTPRRYAWPCHVVPGCASSCHGPTAQRPRLLRSPPGSSRPIAHSVAHSSVAKSRSPPNGRFSVVLGGVRDGSCRTRTMSPRSCQVVPGCVRSCPCVPRGGGCGVPRGARSCQLVPDRVRL